MPAGKAQGQKAKEGGPLRRAALTALCAAALGLAGCGGGEEANRSTAPRDEPAGTEDLRSEQKQSSEPRAQGRGPQGEPKPTSTVPAPAPEAPAPSSAADRVALRGIDESIETYGRTATPSEQARIVSSLREFMAAKASGEYARACELLIAFIREGAERSAKEAEEREPGTLKRPGCAGVLQASLEPISPRLLRDATKIDVASVKVDGEEAYVTYSTPEVKSQIMYMKEEGGEWKVGKVNPDRLL